VRFIQKDLIDYHKCQAVTNVLSKTADKPTFHKGNAGCPAPHGRLKNTTGDHDVVTQIMSTLR